MEKQKVKKTQKQTSLTKKSSEQDISHELNLLIHQIAKKI